MRYLLPLIMILVCCNNLIAQQKSINSDFQKALKDNKRQVICSRPYESTEVKKFFRKNEQYVLMSENNVSDMKFGKMVRYTKSFTFLTVEEKRLKDEQDRIKRQKLLEEEERKRIAQLEEAKKQKQAYDNGRALVIMAAFAYLGWVTDATTTQTKEAFEKSKREGFLPDKICVEGVDYKVISNKNAGINVRQYTKSSTNGVIIYSNNDEYNSSKNYISRVYITDNNRFVLFKEYKDSYKDNSGPQLLNPRNFPIRIEVSYLNRKNDVVSATIIIYKPGNYTVTVVNK